MTEKKVHYIITCEHASNKLPEKWRYLFEDSSDVLESHRGWDPGAIQLASVLADKLDVKLHVYPWSRLLIEPNRSRHHKDLFSEYTRNLSNDMRKELLDVCWSPHRDQVRKEIRKTVSSGVQTIHIGVHTFTPVLRGQERNLDIGLLYDPKRNGEKQFCKTWKMNLDLLMPGYKILRNRPYRGKDDGLATALRKEFSEENYLGIEIEVNQKCWFENKVEWNRIAKRLADSLKLSFL